MQHCRAVEVARTMNGRREHRDSGEFLLEVVSAVVSAPERELYLPFARELYATLHRPPVPDFTRHVG